jgi:hypothetical protein
VRDFSFTLQPGLFPPVAPFSHGLDRDNPFAWSILDSAGRKVAAARTRAGVRLALRALYAGARG